METLEKEIIIKVIAAQKGMKNTGTVISKGLHQTKASSKKKDEDDFDEEEDLPEDVKEEEEEEEASSSSEPAPEDLKFDLDDFDDFDDDDDF